jgi:hypothetical protein
MLCPSPFSYGQPDENEVGESPKEGVLDFFAEIGLVAR